MDLFTDKQSDKQSQKQSPKDSKVESNHDQQSETTSTTAVKKMTSKACQLLKPYLLKDLINVVESFIPEHLLCEQLIDMITDGRVLMRFNLEATRTPNSTPLSCVLNFYAAQTRYDNDLKYIFYRLGMIDNIHMKKWFGYLFTVVCDATSMLYQHLHHPIENAAVPGALGF